MLHFHYSAELFLQHLYDTYSRQFKQLMVKSLAQAVNL